MSRIGNLPIKIPSGVTVTNENSVITVKGPKGELSSPIADQITMTDNDGTLEFTRIDESKPSKSLHGLTRSLVDNMIVGVTDGFSKKLIVEGVGFKVSLAAKTLKMSLGYSHDVEFTPPEGVEISVDKNDITVSGIDKQKVGQAAAEIRKFRKPEPYKGKGIRYDGEHIIRKEGKTAGAA